jgi:hypothetical protein
MERSFGNFDSKTKKTINNKEDVFAKVSQEISKSKDKLDICIKITNDFPTSFYVNEFLINIIDEIKRNRRKIKTRCIINVPQENINDIKQLVSLVEVRYSHGIKDCFFINELMYVGMSIKPKSKYKLQLSPHLTIIKTRSFVEQQQFFLIYCGTKQYPLTKI